MTKFITQRVINQKVHFLFSNPLLMNSIPPPLPHQHRQALPISILSLSTFQHLHPQNPLIERHTPFPIPRQQHTPPQIRHRLNNVLHTFHQPSPQPLSLVHRIDINIRQVDKSSDIRNAACEADEIWLEESLNAVTSCEGVRMGFVEPEAERALQHFREDMRRKRGCPIQIFPFKESVEFQKGDFRWVG